MGFMKFTRGTLSSVPNRQVSLLMAMTANMPRKVKEDNILRAVYLRILLAFLRCYVWHP